MNQNNRNLSSKFGALKLDKSMIYFPDIHIDTECRNSRYDQTDMTMDEVLDDKLSFRLMDNPSYLRISGKFEKMLETQRSVNKTVQFSKDEFEPHRLSMYRPRKGIKKPLKLAAIEKSLDSNESGRIMRPCMANQKSQSPQNDQKFMNKDEVLKLIEIKLKEQKRYFDQKFKILKTQQPQLPIKSASDSSLETIVKQLQMKINYISEHQNMQSQDFTQDVTLQLTEPSMSSPNLRAQHLINIKDQTPLFNKFDEEMLVQNLDLRIQKSQTLQEFQFKQDIKQLQEEIGNFKSEFLELIKKEKVQNISIVGSFNSKQAQIDEDQTEGIIKQLESNFDFKIFDLEHKISNLERIIVGIKSQTTIRTIESLEDSPFRKIVLKKQKKQIKDSAKDGLKFLKETKKVFSPVTTPRKGSQQEYEYYSEVSQIKS